MSNNNQGNRASNITSSPNFSKYLFALAVFAGIVFLGIVYAITHRYVPGGTTPAGNVFTLDTWTGKQEKLSR